MKEKSLELDTFINPSTGADVSFHSISWVKSGSPASIPTGGNLNYHSLPMSGTVEHSHEFPEIILVLSGQVIHRVNGERQMLEANSIVFVRPSDSHGFAPAPGAEPCEMIFLSFSLELFLTLSHYLENDYFLQKYTEPVLPASFRIPENQMNELSLDLLSINSKNMSPSARKIQFKVILATLFTRFFLEDRNYLKSDNVPAWLEKLCELMENPENFIPGLKRMQKLSGYTPEYLCKVFRKYLDKSPTEFINELRVNHAARLLADTDKEIGAIACALNFQSLSRFYHLFRKYYGCAPAQYRKRSFSAKRIL